MRSAHHVLAAVEENHLGREAGGLALVHLHAGVHELLRQCDVLGGVLPVGAEGQHAGHEAGQVVHLVHHRGPVPLRHVRQPRGRRLVDQDLDHAIHGFIEEFAVACEGLGTPPLHPHLDEVLKERVAHRPKRDLLPRPHARDGVEKERVEAVAVVGRVAVAGDGRVGGVLDDVLRHAGVLLVPGRARQRHKLQLLRAKFRQRARLLRPCGVLGHAGGKVDDVVGDAGGRAVGGNQTLSQLHALVHKHPLAREVEGGHEAADNADDGLKDGRLKRDVEVQLRGHPVLRTVEFILHVHNPQRVQRVDDGGTQTGEHVLAMVGFGLQFVHPKGIPLVPPPRVLHRPLDRFPLFQIWPRLDPPVHVDVELVQWDPRVSGAELGGRRGGRGGGDRWHTGYGLDLRSR
mmetsp:Transcript_28219/g.47299  ORF Transcript_28219/g.47299 Transcript_28219/m.47299 type:complete len:402 (+) Transcript_28219:782-1987(+)